MGDSKVKQASGEAFRLTVLQMQSKRNMSEKKIAGTLYGSVRINQEETDNRFATKTGTLYLDGNLVVDGTEYAATMGGGINLDDPVEGSFCVQLTDNGEGFQARIVVNDTEGEYSVVDTTELFEGLPDGTFQIELGRMEKKFQNWNVTFG